MPTNPTIPRLTTAQVRVLEMMAGGSTLTVKVGGFFPGARVDGNRVDARSAKALTVTNTVEHVGYTWQDGDEYRITDLGRAALERAREATA